jgi:muramoyltetrapeptide carboxypeptidase
MPQPPLNLPPALPDGATLGIVAPASPPDPARFAAGLDALRAAGFRLELGAHVEARCGHLAGDDAARAADLNAMFQRDDIHGIVCARGGSGAIRLLNCLDYDAIRTHPKVFVGYSDITVLQLALLRRCGLPTFFAPMVQPDFARGMPPGALADWRRLLSWPEPFGPLDDPRRAAETRTLVGGRTAGPCIGGTLSLVAATLGTPDQPDLEDAIFFFEDIYENPAHVERYLAQLRWAGMLEKAAGFLIGNVTWEATEEERGRFLTLEEVYRDMLAPLGRPAIYNFPFGHIPNPLPLSQGIRVSLDADRRTVEILEPAVRASRA